MTWRELGEWAEKNGASVRDDDCRKRFPPYACQVNLTPGPVCERVIVFSGWRETKGAAKRALCRAVSRILESKR